MSKKQAYSIKLISKSVFVISLFLLVLSTTGCISNVKSENCNPSSTTRYNTATHHGRMAQSGADSAAFKCRSSGRSCYRRANSCEKKCRATGYKGLCKDKFKTSQAIARCQNRKAQKKYRCRRQCRS